MLVVAAGMPKSGTGWWFNVHNDLLVAAGHSDVREVRRRFALDDVLRHHNCLLDDTTPRTLLKLARPALSGASFVVKTHARPSRSLQLLLRSGLSKATYLHRDPRDAALSAFEHAERARREGSHSSFASLTTLESALELMAREVDVAEAWLACPGVLLQRYEDLVQAPVREARRLLDFLGLAVDGAAVAAVLERRQLESRDAVEGWEHQHFNVGEVGRYRLAFSVREHALAEARLGAFLRRAGYES